MINKIRNYIIRKKYKININVGRNFLLKKSNKSKIKIGYLDAKENVSIIIKNEAVFELGKMVFFNNNCTILINEGLTIGNNVMFGPNCVIVDHDHDYTKLNYRDEFINKKICIGDNVWVGSNCTILKGVNIGENCVIAAGSVVNKDCLPNCLYGGSPAKLIKELNKKY